MDCVFMAGLLFMVGTDWNGDRYMINIDQITNVTQQMSISDSQDDMRPRTFITTTNGTIVEDVEILDVAFGLGRCEAAYNAAREQQQQ
jgi:hypothetical protein